MENTEFYTATMARLYAQQGHLEKAAEIYRYLLEREPDHKDIAAALSDVEHELSKEKPVSEQTLVTLFCNWTHLISCHNRLKRFKKIKKIVNL
jgi:hypothetical protein